MSIPADKPIRKTEEDVLNRTKVARLFAEQLLSLDITEGAVVGVLGPWGSGKTSFVNLARNHLNDLDNFVLDFNPWMFSGAEQLVQSFFFEISTQLKVKPSLAEIGKGLEQYGEIFSGMGWLPLVGPWAERGRVVTRLLGKLLQKNEEEGINGRRKKIEKALYKLDKPIFIVIDDIDRLTASEIREIFKLVRLVANFPNVIYIVAFDRMRVEAALVEQGIPGRDYLEKIMQVSIDIPQIPANLLDKQILQAIGQVPSIIDNRGPFDENVWPDIFMEVIRPLIRNMRDVRRYATAIHLTVGDLSGEVSLTDVLALEAIRCFLPNAFLQIHRSVEGLTTTSDITHGSQEESQYLRVQVDLMLEAEDNHKDIVQSFIKRLFPAAERHIGGSHYGTEWKSQWLAERRVAHEDILRLYLERTIGQGLQVFYDAERAFAYMADRSGLDSFLRSLGTERLQDIIDSLETFEEQFKPEHVQPGSVVLLNLLPELPKRQRGIFDIGPDFTVGGVVYRLLRSLENPESVEEAVRNILRHVNTLYAKEKLIAIVGHRENAGHGLVSESAASRFEKEWRDEVRSASIDALVEEPDLHLTLLRARQGAGHEEPPVIIPDSPQITLALLRAARTEAISLAIGSRAVRRSPRLEWNALIKLFGAEDPLRERIKMLEATKPDGADDLLDLANKYLEGWRPGDTDED